MNQMYNDTQNSWISIKSLKNEAEISFLFSDRPNTELSDACSPKSDVSISKEPRSTTNTNESINVINTLAYYWKEEFDKQRNFSCSPKYQNKEIHTKDTDYRKILKMYENRIQILKAEINTLKPKLLNSQNKVQKLFSLLKYTQKTHTLEIQQLQKNHEKRVLKMQKDFGSILSTLQSPKKTPNKSETTSFKNPLKPSVPKFRNNSTPA